MYYGDQEGAKDRNFQKYQNKSRAYLKAKPTIGNIAKGIGNGALASYYGTKAGLSAIGKKLDEHQKRMWGQGRYFDAFFSSPF